MATYTTILHMTLVATNQNQKETTINSNFAIMEAALNDDIALSLSGGDRTLTTDEFTKYFHQIYSGQTAARQVTIPNTPRFFAVTNSGSYDITVKANGSSGAFVTVAAGKRVLVLSDGVDVLAITSGVSNLQDLSDISGVDAASAGQFLGYNGTLWEPVDSVGDVHFFAPGVPTASQKVFRQSITRATRFFGDFADSQGSADTASTATATFLVKKNGSDVGTIVFTSSSTATFTTSGSASVDFAPGDVLSIVAPSSPDATLADISATLKGVLI